mmetsp:Transcript_3417/g.8877  ORF Transcript_3417/g.8877 Transcript_3417/m.8877 type:complete len:214 (-) Transcript_3417:214-855(-)
MSSKKAAGQARKAAQEEQKALEEARAAEAAAAAEWDQGAKKKNAKAAAAEEKKAAKAERKAEADAEHERELEEASQKKVTGNKAKKGPGKYAALSAKLTQAEIATNLDEEKEAKRKAEEKEKKGAVNDYLGRLEENDNRVEAIDARSIDAALAALDVSNEKGVDKVKLKAAFEAFSETELPRIKAEKPGLKLSQYKEMVWKAWQKAPENPLRK